MRRGLTWHRSRAALAADVGHGADHELLPGIAALFNGALFRASTLDVIGVPDLRLFIRGDEVEMHRRLVRSDLPFGTALGAVYLHPRADADDKPMLRGHLHARDPDDPVKRYYTFRNRGFLTAQPGMRRVGVAELPRFAWYFLVTKRSPREFVRWLRLVRQGGWNASTGPEERPEPPRPTARRPGSHLAALSSRPIQPRSRPLLRLAMRPPGRRSLRLGWFRTLLAEDHRAQHHEVDDGGQALGDHPGGAHP